MLRLIHDFASDGKVLALVALVALDLVLGVSAALAKGTFSWGRLADTLRDDVLGKLVPYFALWAAVHLAGDVEVGDFGLLEEGAFALAAATLAASVVGSLKELGLAKRVPAKRIERTSGIRG